MCDKMPGVLESPHKQALSLNWYNYQNLKAPCQFNLWKSSNECGYEQKSKVHNQKQMEAKLKKK